VAASASRQRAGRATHSASRKAGCRTPPPTSAGRAAVQRTPPPAAPGPLARARAARREGQG
ncbi:unnamed protein product, partial [Acidocella sp. C78]